MEHIIAREDSTTEVIDMFHVENLTKFIKFIQQPHFPEGTEVDEDYNKFVKEISAFVGSWKPKIPSRFLYQQLISGLRDGWSLETMPDTYTLLQQLSEVYPPAQAGSLKDSSSGKDLRHLITYPKVCPLIYQQNGEKQGMSNGASRDQTGEHKLLDLHELLAYFANDLKKTEDPEVQHNKVDNQQSEVRGQTQSRLKSVKNGKKFGAVCLLEHLTCVLEDDLSCRITVYHENPADSLLKESALNTMLNFESSKGQLCEYLFQIIGGTCVEEALLPLPHSRGRDTLHDDPRGKDGGESMDSDDKAKQVRYLRKMKVTVRRRRAEVSPIKSGLSPTKRRGPMGSITPVGASCRSPSETGFEGGAGSGERVSSSVPPGNAVSPGLHEPRHPGKSTNSSANGGRFGCGDSRSIANGSQGGGDVGGSGAHAIELAGEGALTLQSKEPKQLATPTLLRERHYNLMDLCATVQRLLSLTIDLYSAMEKGRRMFLGFNRNKREELMELMCCHFHRTLDSIQKKTHFLSTMVQRRHQVAFIVDYVCRNCKKKNEKDDAKEDRWTAEDVFRQITDRPHRLVKVLKAVDLIGLLLSQLTESCACLLQEHYASSDSEALLGPNMTWSSFPAMVSDAVQALLSFGESPQGMRENRKPTTMASSIKERLQLTADICCLQLASRDE